MKKIEVGIRYFHDENVHVVPCRPTAPEYEVALEIIGSEVIKIT